MSNRVVLVQHSEERADNRVSAYLAAHGYEADVRRPFSGDRLPAHGENFAGCVIFGGLYNAYDIDLHTFLREEYALIGRCLEANIPMLGICQGAQMIAWRLGAHVGPPESNLHEFGYYELTPTAEAGISCRLRSMSSSRTGMVSICRPARPGWPRARCFRIRLFALAIGCSGSSSTPRSRRKAFAACRNGAARVTACRAYSRAPNRTG